MKIASFNVENLFERAIALNQDSNAANTEMLGKTARLNELLQSPTYTNPILTEMKGLITELGLAKSDTGKFTILRQVRGRLISRPRNKPFKIKATGRNAWVGWAELRRGPVNEIAMTNTGRVIKEVDADVLAVVEAENRVALEDFSEKILKDVKGAPYEQVMLIDGNDERGIDVALMTTHGYKIGAMRSHIHDLKPDGHPIFSRDCPEYAVTTPAGELIWVLPNHFKSKFGGDDPASKAKRLAQSTRVAEIYQRLRNEGHDKIVVLGDFNDTPKSPPLKPLLEDTDLKDVSEHATFNPGEFKGIGTYGLGNDNQKLDYILLSPALFGRVTASGLFRKGAWPGKQPPRWTKFDELKEEIHAASDHHLIWAQIAEPPA